MAAYTELTIDQGATFSSTVDLTNSDATAMNVAGYTFVSQIRKSFYSTNPTANIAVTIDDAANGRVRLSANADTTANIKAGRYVYDLKMTTDENITIRVIEGIVTITPQVSK